MEDLIMQEIYGDMVDCISSILFENEQWTKDNAFFDFESIVSFEQIVQWFGGWGYTTMEIRYCYDTIKNHYIHCKELNILKAQTK